MTVAGARDRHRPDEISQRPIFEPSRVSPLRLLVAVLVIVVYLALCVAAVKGLVVAWKAVS